MKPFFAIPPWEYPGANFDPSPHATVRHELGDKKRNFWLKMRDGVIYFRETTRVPVFAVPKLLDLELAKDPDRLTDAWKHEVSRDNYGSFVVSHRQWPRIPVAANYCLIIRADGSGWIKEHFDSEWLEFSISSGYSLPLWQSQFALGDTAATIVAQTKGHFLNRSVNAAHFQTISPHWSGGSPDEMLSVLRSAAQLLVPPDEMTKDTIEWRRKSNSAFQGGSVASQLTHNWSSRYQFVWDLVKWHYGFVGIECKKVSDHPELREKFPPHVWRKGFDQWRENWRGNWHGSQCQLEFSSPPLAPPSHHDKLEAVLTLREFLRDKVPAAKMNSLLNDALAKG